MEDILKVANQQRVQNISTSQTNQTNKTESTQESKKPQSVVKELQEEASSTKTEINSKEQMDALVSSLNKAISPISTNISFSVDKNDIFFVSVRESISDRLISRFPAEQAVAFLPKMQEVTGILFDTRG